MVDLYTTLIRDKPFIQVVSRESTHWIHERHTLPSGSAIRRSTTHGYAVTPSMSMRPIFSIGTLPSDVCLPHTHNVDPCTRVDDHHQRVFFRMILRESLIIETFVRARSVYTDHVGWEFHGHVVEFRQARCK